MFAFFNRILEMYRTEYGRSCNNDNIDTAIDQLFVCIQTNETFVFRNITSFFFQLVGQSVYTFFECIGNGNDCHAVCSIPEIHNNVYNAYTEGRARLFGYVINRKMEIIQDGTVAYMSLMENEMRRFQFQQGDSEGFVNYALTIKKMKMSAMFLAHRKFIRVSLRSRGDVDVNLFARKYFNGGGHKNAAGGKSFVSMQETIDHYIKSVKEFAQDGHLG